MLTDWQSWNGTQGFLPFGLRVWAWIAIAGVPLAVAAFHGHKGLAPIAAAIALVLALPWCYHGWTQNYPLGNGQTMTYRGATPNVLAHALVAAFAVFICWWGAKLASRTLVNLGVVAFAVAVAWFYFSDLMDKVGRSLGLIGLGVLFLAGGWALEKMRRRILARMEPQVSEEAG
jgi:TRAP-type C4-dicarboxylate transport system permease small subunit